MACFKRARDWLNFLCLVGLFTFSAASAAQAQIWEYNINAGEEGINASKTSAVVDTDNHEIRLLKNMPGAASFLEEGINDYVINTPAGLTRYFFDGTQMQSYVIVPAAQLNDSVSVFTSNPYPDVIVGQNGTTGMEVTHYSFDGSNMVKNPGQTIAGYTQISKVISRNVDTAFIDQDKILYYGRDADGNPIKIPALSDENGSINPIDIALFTDNYDAVFIDKTDIKYLKDGSITTALAGMTGAISISATNFTDASGAVHREAAIISGNEKKHYSISNTGTWTANTALSVTAGLAKASCVVLHPDNHNCLIVDGDDVKFYMFDGTKMVYNPALSVTVAGLRNMGFYTYKGIAESKAYTADQSVFSVKLSATEVLEPDTSTQYFVTATSDVPSGSNWKACTLDTWQSVDEGAQLRWKAILKTNKRNSTPRIRPVIKLATNSKPNPPLPNIPDPAGGDYYLDSTPLLRWKFTDPDIPDGDTQTAFQVVVYTDAAGTNQIIDTGKVLSSAESYTIDQAATGLLWNTGVSSFWVKIKTWDQTDLESEFCSLHGFGVRAFDRPRVVKTYNPPNNTERPIALGSVQAALPASKAGGMIVLEVDSIGIDTGSATFPYGTHTSSFGDTFKVKAGFAGVTNKRWTVSFYTDANTTICPDGTIVNGLLEGNGIAQLLIMQDAMASLGAEPDGTEANWWTWLGYRWWSEGAVRIENSAFENWIVVLGGRKN